MTLRMWIEISKDIFDDAEFKALNYLYQILSWYPRDSNPRYNVFIDIENFEENENFISLLETEFDLKNTLQSQFDYFISTKPSGERKDYYITYKKAHNFFNLEEAIRYFNQPVSIVLENNKNDSYFITSLIYYFGMEDGRNVLREHLDNGWIRFENAGGCTNVSNFIKGFLKSFDNLASINNRNIHDYFRGIVILDSDISYLNEKSKHDDLCDFLNTIMIKYHILKKRMMENYMPDEVINDLKQSVDDDLKKWINTYLHLNDEQKDFLNFYYGFSNEFEMLDPKVKALYGSVSDINFSILKNGFKYKGKQFKNEFPRLFLESELVNKKTLTTRFGSDEYLEIINKIKSLI